MFKTITKLFGISGAVSLLTLTSYQIALAACTVNGKDVPCDVVADKVGGFLAWGFGAVAVITVIGILLTVFWILMIVHAFKHDVEHKAVWVTIMIFTGALGAAVYYFAVKREVDRTLAQQGSATVPTQPQPPVQSIDVSGAATLQGV